MKPEQQNIAIAQACGWTDCRLAIKGAGGGTRSATAHGKPPKRNYEADCPNYCNDLNAMHKAENSMKIDDLKHYQIMLCDWLSADWGRASASIRAEAFLRTLDLWKDDN